MSKSESALLALAESIADGLAIDWDSAEAGASHEEKDVIRELRILSNLAGLHRSIPKESTGGPGGSFLRRSLTAPAIGKWAHLTLLERLGGGTFGDVYRAWDADLEREVALKVLRASEDGGDLNTSRIANEGRLLARVHHPNVITVHGVAAHDGRVGLWMELVRGVTLEQQLAAHGPFSAREAALIGIDLCRALAAIHGAGLIHRDVKAQNVMREDGGRIVLMDLGTGRDAARRLADGIPELAGTPLYLAPEIFLGAAASGRTDLYSLGVLLYHLVTGSFPVRATTVDGLQQAHAARAVVRLRDARADLPSAFVRVVDRAICEEAAPRYETAGAFEADLLETLGETAPMSPAAPVQPVPAIPLTSTSTATPMQTEPAVPATWWRRGAIVAASIAAVLTLAVAGWPALRRTFSAAPTGAVRSIAVLPLANLSGDPAQEYFADGITDELIGTLGRIGRVNVISRTSTMRFKGAAQTVPEIARALGVDAVLEGSLRVIDPTDGGARRVRVNARLIYAGTDTQLWDRTFEAVVSDVLALQTDIARMVAEGINVKLAGVQAPQRQVNPQAYDAYLRARYLWNKRTLPDSRRAIDGFKKAVDADPTSPLAWSGLADGYIVLASYDADRPRSARTEAKAAAAKALELDPDLAEAHAALGNVAWTYDWDAPAAEREFKRALELNPNYATAHGWYGLYLNQVGRGAEALAEHRRAQQLDPLSPVLEINVARSYYFSRQYDEALRALQDIARRTPDYWIVHAILGQTHLARGRYAEAVTALERARRLSPEAPRNLGVLGDAYARAGRKREARKLLADLEVLGRAQYVSPVYAAMIHTGLGETARALDLLDQAFVDRSDWIMLLRVDPAFDPLRRDGRFDDLLRRAQTAVPAP